MKRKLTLSFLFLAFAIISAFAQRNPSPFLLMTNDFQFAGFETTTETKFPDHFVGWRGPQVVATNQVPSHISRMPSVIPTDVQASGNITTLGLRSAGTTAASGIFNLTTTAAALQGFGITNLDGAGGPFALVLAVNTQNCKGITLEWRGRLYALVVDAGRAGVQAQFRTDSVGIWTNIANSQFYSLETDLVNGTAQNIVFRTTLPEAVEGKPYVQIRWLYFAQEDAVVFAGGDGIHIDDISVTVAERAVTFANSSLVKSTKLVYPNPSNGIFNLNLPQNEKLTTIEVFNLLGFKVAELSDFESNQINLGDLPAGQYTLKASGKTNQYTQRILIQ